MSQSSPTQLHRAHLRVLHIGEDMPSYDAEAHHKREPFGMILWELYDRLEGDADAQAVLLALLRHANKDGECWPSIATICKRTGRSDKQVRLKINRLVEVGIIAKEPRVTGGMKSVNVYRICQKSPENQIGMEYRTSGTENRTDRYGVPDSAVPGTDRTISSELEPKELEKKTAKPKSPRKSAPDTPVPENLVDLIPADVWAAMRDETRLTDDQLRFETALMIDRNLRKGGTSKNWVASWRSWMRSPYRQSQPVPARATGTEMPPEIRALPWNSAARLKWEHEHRSGAS